MDTVTKANYYALLIAIACNKSAQTALNMMGLTIESEREAD